MIKGTLLARGRIEHRRWHHTGGIGATIVFIGWFG
jgi:hypothetical protein